MDYNKEDKKTGLGQNCPKPAQQFSTAYDVTQNIGKTGAIPMTRTKTDEDDDLNETAEDRAYFSNI